MSASLATVEFRPAAPGTRLVITEQDAFLDGYDDAGSRERGTQSPMDNLVASLRSTGGWTMKLITPTRGAWLACLLLLGEPVLAAEVAYTLDPAHTETRFNWTHLGYSHPGAGFDDITGTLRWNAGDPRKSSVTVDIAVASIHTHVPLLDKILLSHKYFDAARFPRITFVSTRVQPMRQANHYRVVGNLTVHGISKTVVLEVTRNQTGAYPMFNFPAMGFDASTRFKRSDFGLGEGVPWVSDEIRVRISTEAMEAEGYARAKPAMDAMAAKAEQEANGQP